MYSRTHRNLFSIIVIFGHFGAFLFGFFALAIGGGRVNQEFFNLILMASPVLSSTALAALVDLLARPSGGSRGRKVSGVFSAVTLFIPSVLVFCVVIVFYLFTSQSSIASPGDLKIALGVLETFFGAFLGAISKSLFEQEGS